MYLRPLLTLYSTTASCEVLSTDSKNNLSVPVVAIEDVWILSSVPVVWGDDTGLALSWVHSHIVRVQAGSLLGIGTCSRSQSSTNVGFPFHFDLPTQVWLAFSHADFISGLSLSFPDTCPLSGWFSFTLLGFTRNLLKFYWDMTKNLQNLYPTPTKYQLCLSGLASTKFSLK